MKIHECAQGSDEIVAGGQGRSADDIWFATVVLGFAWLVGAMLVAFLWLIDAG